MILDETLAALTFDQEHSKTFCCDKLIRIAKNVTKTRENIAFRD